jgi:ubiquinone/menaquinone biosynthesis C-methylase UbiE
MENSIEYIEGINYSNFVSLVKERNRPSGGIKTIQTVIVNSRLNEESKVLEIGCTTGFTSINLVYLSKCQVTGIDINEYAIQTAKESALKEELTKYIDFCVCDARKLPFKDDYFDMVWCSNVVSFIKEQDEALTECLRVLKFGGTLTVIPIYYIQMPPESLVEKVSKLIGNKIDIWTKQYWMNKIDTIARRNGYVLELYFSKDFRYKDQTNRINQFIDVLLSKPHLKTLSPDIRESLRKKALDFYHTFNENLKYCGYSILLYQKRHEPEEMELFLTEEIV